MLQIEVTDAGSADAAQPQPSRRFDHAGGRWQVDYLSNQSTGYCPDPGSWAAIASVLDELELLHPPNFTQAIVFRRCPNCAELNTVKDDFFVCAFCENDLPAQWNIATRPPD